MSASTWSFCWTAISTVGVGAGPLFIQALHSLHVSTTSGIMSRTGWGTPAALRIFSIWTLVACHHLRCSRRTSRSCCAAVPVRSIRRLCVTSKDVQSSGSAPPTPLSMCRTGACRGARSGPRPRGAGPRSASTGGGAGSEDPLASGSRSGAGSAPRCRSEPRRPADGSVDALTRPSRGRVAERLWGARLSTDAHRHSPGMSVCSACPRGRGGSRAQPGHVHSGSGSTSGNLHTPGSRVCSRRVLAKHRRHPGHRFQAGSARSSGGGSSPAVGASPASVPTEG